MKKRLSSFANSVSAIALVNYKLYTHTTNNETKAAFLSVWDSERKESLRVDLWTKDMPLDEMKIFFYQILTSMSATYKRATQDEKMSQTMLDFCDYFAEKLELKK